jgi:membrane protein DedA with SNARE-associated domain
MPDALARAVELISGYGGLWIYLIVFCAAVTENLFPPSPGDTILFAGAVVAARGAALWPLVLTSAVVGNVAGAMLVYWFGFAKGRQYFLSHHGRWIEPERLHRIERWFNRYGTRIILLSRFLTGIRSGVALTAGLGEVPAWRMATFTAISTLLWNALIVAVALAFQHNWAAIYEFARLYNGVVFLLLAVLAAGWGAYRWWLHRRSGHRP